MKDSQWTFMQSQVLSLSVSAAFLRSHPLPVYAPDVSNKLKREVQDAIRAVLTASEALYAETPDGDAHIHNIEMLASNISTHHGNALIGGRLRIGTAQKALNLYLKYLWCLGRIKEPPHCPVDTIVLAGLPGVANIRWTQMDSIDEYKRCIEAISQAAVASGQSVAQWELLRWNGAQPGDPADAPRA